MARLGNREREQLRADAQAAQTCQLMHASGKRRRDTSDRMVRRGDRSMSLVGANLSRTPKATDAAVIARGQRQLDARERAAGWGGVRGRLSVD